MANQSEGSRPTILHFALRMTPRLHSPLHAYPIEDIPGQHAGSRLTVPIHIYWEIITCMSVGLHTARNIMPEYLVRFVQLHESFRQAELQALADVADVAIEFVKYNEEVSATPAAFPFQHRSNSQNDVRAARTRSSV